jgi:hypothetical protein
MNLKWIVTGDPRLGDLPVDFRFAREPDRNLLLKRSDIFLGHGAKRVVPREISEHRRMNATEKVETFERKKSTFTVDLLHSAIVDLPFIFATEKGCSTGTLLSTFWV